MKPLRKHTAAHICVFTSPTKSSRKGGTCRILNARFFAKCSVNPWTRHAPKGTESIYRDLKKNMCKVYKYKVDMAHRSLTQGGNATTRSSERGAEERGKPLVRSEGAEGIWGYLFTCTRGKFGEGRDGDIGEGGPDIGFCSADG